jgi:hypothetical protein
MPYNSEDKLQFEVEKLNQEVKLLKQPWKQPTFWIGIIALAVSIAGNLVQLSTMDYKSAKAEAAVAQAKLDKINLDNDFSKKSQEYSELKDQVTEANNYLAGLNCSEPVQCVELVKKARRKFGELEEQINITQASTSTSVSQENKPANSILQENKSVFTSKPAQTPSPNPTKTPQTTPEKTATAKDLTNKLQIAKDKESEGFKNLINGNYDGAISSFQASEDTYNTYHNVYDIARLLRKNKSQMDDPVKKKEVFQTIVKKYPYGAPPDLLRQVEAIANQ